jgi:hypothetical protein
MNCKWGLFVFFGVSLFLTGCLTTENEQNESGLVVGVNAPSEKKIIQLDQDNVVRAPAWKAGSEWSYSDGYSLRVKSTAGDVTVFQRLDAPERWYSRRGFLREDSKSNTALRKIIYRTAAPTAGMFLAMGSPLAFHREYLSNGKLMVHNTSWSVEGREKVSVPAGQFDAWVIVMRTRSLKSNWMGFERWWYSPDVQHFVRMEYKYGSSPEGSRVLMSYNLGAKALSKVAD